MSSEEKGTDVIVNQHFKWISVDNELPKAGKKVLCRIEPKALQDEKGRCWSVPKSVVEEIRFEVGHRMNNGSKNFIVGNHFEWDMGKVTHWMNIDDLMF